MTANYRDAFRAFCADGEFFEFVIAAIYRAWLLPGQAAIDGGAHIGRHTGQLARHLGPAGRVFAVEALPNYAAELRRQTAHFQNVTVLPFAISDFTGQSAFRFVHTHPAYSGVCEGKYPAGAQVDVINVQASTLDTLIPVDAGIAFIKLDLEGGEYRALKGASALLNRRRPLVCFEHGGAAAAQQNDYRLGDYFAFWQAHGYKLFDLFGRPIGEDRFAQAEIWYLLAARTPEQLELIDNIHIAIARGAQDYLIEMKTGFGVGPLSPAAPAPAPAQPDKPWWRSWR